MNPTLARWRALLGRERANSAGLPNAEGGPDTAQLDQAGELLDYLFRPSEPTAAGRRGGRHSGDGVSVAHWVDQVRELFPQQAREVLEGELVRRRGIGELLDRPDVLARIEPSLELVKTLITHSQLLDARTRVLARKIIDQAVSELKERLKLQVEPALTGAIRRDRHSPRPVARNLDLKTTIRRNLQHWDAQRKAILVDRLYFYAAERRQRPWHIIVAVDQSGSMLDSAIHSAIMASIFAELPSVRTSLFLFDTRIADLSDQLGQPVDVLMKLQLGGGTDIAQAIGYATTLIREPARSIVLLITDFYEGGNAARLVTQVGELCDAGVRCIGLAALGSQARPQYDKALAQRCRKVGMDILSCTPERLSDAIAEIIRG